MAFLVTLSTGEPGKFMFADLSRDGRHLNRQAIWIFPPKADQIQAVLDLLAGWAAYYRRSIRDLAPDVLKQLGITLPPLHL